MTIWAVAVERTPTVMDPNPVNILGTYTEYADADEALGRIRDTRKRAKLSDAHLYRLERHE